MLINKIPKVSEALINEYTLKAKSSLRKRAVHHLHKKGDSSNKSFCWILKDSYMQPHCHESDEKIEQISLIFGQINVIFFNEYGDITKIYNLDLPNRETIIVPAFQYHTYIVKSDIAVTFETMEGVYNHETWKKFPVWAPKEESDQAKTYFNDLRSKIDLLSL